jgi:hypothetical protein
MILKKIFAFLLSGLFFFCQVAQSQGPAIPTMGPLPTSKFPRTIHELYLEGGQGNRLQYSQVRGSPFWKDEYSLASLFNYDNTLLGRTKVKVNFFTGEVYYLDKEQQELVAPKEIVTKIVIHPEMDTSRKLTVFRSSPSQIFLFDQPVEEYVQELNTGDLKLLKLTKRKVASADSLFGTLKRYYFTSELYYFVLYKRGTNYVKRLNRETVLAFVPNSSEFDSWLVENKISFKKEEDIVRFFDYYNQQQALKNK